MDHHPYVLTLGNEKGGTGKSTLSLHLIVHLLRLGFKVGSVDIDARQGTLTQYLKNRKKFIEKSGVDLPCPQHFSLPKSELDSTKAAQADEESRANQILASLKDCDVVIMDTPGNDTYLSSWAHRQANTIITPINDSFIDLDVLMKIDDLDKNRITPSHYAEMVWNEKKNRLALDRTPIEWVVVRNRLTNIASRNKEEVWKVVNLLSRRIGFTVGTGFTERVIFREMFLTGATLLDLADCGIKLKLSHVSARQELRALLSMIKLPKLKEALDKEAA